MSNGSQEKLGKILTSGKRVPSAPAGRPGRAASGWYWPTQSRHITQGVTPTHRALDLGGRMGDPVFATTSGQISFIGTGSRGYGTNIRLQTDTGQEVIYGHLSGVSVKPGEVVRAGQVIGLIGSTGNSTGPHLHFEVRVPGPDRFSPGWTSTVSAFDPFEFLGLSPKAPGGPIPSLSAFTLTTGSPLVPKGVLQRDLLAMRGGSGGVPTEDELRERLKELRGSSFFAARTSGSTNPTVPDKNGKTADDIRIGNLGVFGDVTIPKAGKMATRIVVVVLAVIVFWVSLAALLSQNATVRRVATAVAESTPVGAGIKAAVGKGK